MNCEELNAILTRTPRCEHDNDVVRLRTDCLYPSSDPVYVYVVKLRTGYRVSDRGGALRSAIIHGATWQGNFEKACKRYSVILKGGEIVAESPSEDWLYPAILAVSNASAAGARAALDAAASKAEQTLKAAIFEELKRAVPERKIAKNYEHTGRSGHPWQMDYAVRDEGLVLIKAVSQNGNSINSNYAAFGDIGDQQFVHKFSVYDKDLAQDSEALLRQVAELVPLQAVMPMTRRYASQLA